MELPTIEVRYEGLKVEAECEIVEGKALPTLWNTAKRVLSVSIFSSCCYLDSVIASKRLSLKFCFIAFLQELVKLTGAKTREAKISILNDVNGIIKPGRLGVVSSQV